MFIHVGGNVIVSDKRTVGVFNAETIKMSDLNRRYFDEMDEEAKSIIVDTDDELINSKVSSFTIMKRESINKEEFIWRRYNE